MNRIQNFFWFCSGANIALLKKTPTEQNKYAGIGATVFFTGLFATVSGAYALYFIFNDANTTVRITASLLFGLIWGAMIFNLDRYIVSSMKKNGSTLSEFKLAAPRFLLAAIIAFVISKPLELQIFHTSIEYELELMKQEEIKKQEVALTSRYQNDMNLLDSEIKNLQKDIDTKTNYRNKADEEARKEADGSGGTMKRGAATIYNLKKADANKAQQELEELTTTNKPLIDAKQKLLFDKKRTVDSLKASVKRGSYDGFDKRLAALGNVSAKNSTISIASIFVMLLFLAIEIAPVLVKLLSSRGPYDDLLEAHEHTFYNYKQEQVSKRNQKMYEELLEMSETGNHAVNERIETNIELRKRMTEAEKEIAQAMIKQWKYEQMNKTRTTADY